MIELRTLGALDLKASDGTDLGSILAQPKRLSLLVYLALQNGREFASPGHAPGALLARAR